MTAAPQQGAASPAAVPPFNPQQAISALTTDARSGYRTTEFWIAITTWVLPILALIFHRDLSSLAMPLSAVAAGGANAAYSVSRAVTKNGHAKAIATVTALPSVVAAAVSAGAHAGTGAAGSGGAGTGGPGGTAGAGGRAAQPGSLDGSDTTELLRSMTAALQALTIAVTKIPSQPLPEIPAQPRAAQPRTTQPRTAQPRTTQPKAAKPAG